MTKKKIKVNERNYLVPGCKHEFAENGFCKICGGWVDSKRSLMVKIKKP